jgi:hypothetical protein
MSDVSAKLFELISGLSAATRKRDATWSGVPLDRPDSARSDRSGAPGKGHQTGPISAYRLSTESGTVLLYSLDGDDTFPFAIEVTATDESLVDRAVVFKTAGSERIADAVSALYGDVRSSTSATVIDGILSDLRRNHHG